LSKKEINEFEKQFKLEYKNEQAEIRKAERQNDPLQAIGGRMGVIKKTKKCLSHDIFYIFSHFRMNKDRFSQRLDNLKWLFANLLY